jgi:hypothetical protein
MYLDARSFSLSWPLREGGREGYNYVLIKRVTTPKETLLYISYFISHLVFLMENYLQEAKRVSVCVEAGAEFHLSHSNIPLFNLVDENGNIITIFEIDFLNSNILCILTSESRVLCLQLRTMTLTELTRDEDILQGHTWMNLYCHNEYVFLGFSSLDNTFTVAKCNIEGQALRFVCSFQYGEPNVGWITAVRDDLLYCAIDDGYGYDVLAVDTNSMQLVEELHLEGETRSEEIDGFIFWHDNIIGITTDLNPGGNRSVVARQWDRHGQLFMQLRI